MLNVKIKNALKELQEWSTKNHLVPHPKKCEAVMLLRGSFIGPLNTLILHTVQPHDKMGDPRTVVRRDYR